MFYLSLFWATAKLLANPHDIYVSLKSSCAINVTISAIYSTLQFDPWSMIVFWDDSSSLCYCCACIINALCNWAISVSHVEIFFLIPLTSVSCFCCMSLIFFSSYCKTSPALAEFFVRGTLVVFWLLSNRSIGPDLIISIWSLVNATIFFFSFCVILGLIYICSSLIKLAVFLGCYSFCCTWKICLIWSIQEF